MYFVFCLPANTSSAKETLEPENIRGPCGNCFTRGKDCFLCQLHNQRAAPDKGPGWDIRTENNLLEVGFFHFKRPCFHDEYLGHIENKKIKVKAIHSWEENLTLWKKVIIILKNKFLIFVQTRHPMHRVSKSRTETLFKPLMIKCLINAVILVVKTTFHCPDAY